MRLKGRFILRDVRLHRGKVNRFSGTRVLLTAPLRPELGLSGSDGGLPVADSRHPDAVESAIRSLASSDGLLIVACAISDYEEIRRIVTHAKIRTGHTRIAIETIPGTPLAINVVASLVDEIGNSDDEPIARQLALLDYLRDNLWSAVWLPGVAKLRTPAPSMFQHVMSWLPGAGFLAKLSPTMSVVRLNRTTMAGVPDLPGHAVIHSPTEAPEWVVPAVIKALGQNEASEIVPIRASIDSYGTKSAAEFIALPIDFLDLSRPAAEDIADCPGCGIRHARQICPFCKMAATVAEPQGAAQ